MAVVATRHIWRHGRHIPQVLVQWSDLPPEESTWEDKDTIFPHALTSAAPECSTPPPLQLVSPPAPTTSATQTSFPTSMTEYAGHPLLTTLDQMKVQDSDTQDTGREGMRENKSTNSRDQRENKREEGDGQVQNVGNMRENTTEVRGSQDQKGKSVRENVRDNERETKPTLILTQPQPETLPLPPKPIITLTHQSHPPITASTSTQLFPTIEILNPCQPTQPTPQSLPFDLLLPDPTVTNASVGHFVDDPAQSFQPTLEDEAGSSEGGIVTSPTLNAAIGPRSKRVHKWPAWLSDYNVD